MKKVIGICLAVTSVAVCGISGEYFTRALPAKGVAVTNNQANASWDLTAVSFKFIGDLPVSTETVRVTRVSQNIEVVLGASQTFAGSMFLSLPDGLTFKFGDVVKVYGGGATGVVQVFTKP
jgi:hypothetical protein